MGSLCLAGEGKKWQSGQNSILLHYSILWLIFLVGRSSGQQYTLAIYSPLSPPPLPDASFFSLNSDGHTATSRTSPSLPCIVHHSSCWLLEKLTVCVKDNVKIMDIDEFVHPEYFHLSWSISTIVIVMAQFVSVHLIICANYSNTGPWIFNQ